MSFGAVREVAVYETGSVKFSYDGRPASTTPPANTRTDAFRGERVGAGASGSSTSSISPRSAAKGLVRIRVKDGKVVQPPRPPTTATVGNREDAMREAEEFLDRLDNGRRNSRDTERKRGARELMQDIADHLDG